MAAPGEPFYGHDLAVVHHRGFAGHAAACAPAIVEFLAPVRARRGLVLELGCGTGLEWGEARRDAPKYSAAGADWAIITEFSRPAPDRFVRDITTFVPAAGGLWRRDGEHHENVLIDTARIPALLGRHGVQARVSASFGAETLPLGLRAITGHKPASGT